MPPLIRGNLFAQGLAVRVRIWEESPENEHAAREYIFPERTDMVKPRGILRRMPPTL
jgi:hypothetical protein